MKERHFDYSNGKGTYTERSVVVKNNKSYVKTDTMSIDVKKSAKDVVSNGASTFGTLISIIVGLMLLIMIMRVMLGSNQTMTFAGLLESLQSAPRVNTSFLLESVDVANTLREVPIIGGLLAFFVDVFNVLLFSAQGVIQVMVYAAWFFGYIFV